MAWLFISNIVKVNVKWVIDALKIKRFVVRFFQLSRDKNKRFKDRRYLSYAIWSRNKVLFWFSFVGFVVLFDLFNWGSCL